MLMPQLTTCRSDTAPKTKNIGTSSRVIPLCQALETHALLRPQQPPSLAAALTDAQAHTPIGRLLAVSAASNNNCVRPGAPQMAAHTNPHRATAATTSNLPTPRLHSPQLQPGFKGCRSRRCTAVRCTAAAQLYCLQVAPGCRLGSGLSRGPRGPVRHLPVG